MQCLGAHLALIAELAVGNARMMGAAPVSFWVGGSGLGENLTYLALWLIPMSTLSPALMTSGSPLRHAALAALAMTLVAVTGLITNLLFSSPVSALRDLVVFPVGVGSVVVLALLVPVGLWASRRTATRETVTSLTGGPSAWSMFIAGLLTATLGVGLYFFQRAIAPASDARLISRLGVLALVAVIPSALFVLGWRDRSANAAPRVCSALGFASVSAWLVHQQ